MRKLVYIAIFLAVASQAVGQDIDDAQRELLLQSLPADVREIVDRELENNSRDAPPEFPETVLPAESKEEPTATDGIETRIAAADTLVISFSLPEDEELADTVLKERPYVRRLLGSRTYSVTNGIVEIVGVRSIPIAGLTADEAATRIAAEPVLADLGVEVARLPLEPTGAAALKHFGYELFVGVPTTFAPATDIPVPADYVIGPGDTISVSLYGNENADYALAVTREGWIDVPDIGPVSVAGMRFDAMKEEISNRIGEQKIGVRTSITLGELRSIRVFILGDVTRPGSYTVSGLSTMTNALFVSGGVDSIGSLRDVQLKRNGRVVGRLDLYDLLLRGDTRADRRLQPGDVIFVPPIGQTVGVTGEVVRPAIYEIKKERTVQQIMELAGGLKSTAYPAASKLDRISDSGDRIIVDLDLTTTAGRDSRIRGGDTILIPTVIDRLAAGIELVGHVYRPGPYQWRAGLRLTDVIPSVDVLKPQADLNYVLIRREALVGGQIGAISTSLHDALIGVDPQADLLLEPRDRIYVFDATSESRSIFVQPLLEELSAQATRDQPAKEVTIGGRVRAPGQYPLEPGMRITDLIRAAGDLEESAYDVDAELTRYFVADDRSRETELVTIDLAAVLSGDQFANLALEPHDYLNVREIPDWAGQQSVELDGEVRFPGKYPIRRGETLGSVLDRAGGLTDLAFAEGSVFVREDLKERERQQVSQLTQRLESDLATLALQARESGKDVSESFSIGQGLLNQLRATEPTGRLVIDINRVLGAVGDPEKDITLKNGDQLLIPPRTQDVTVIGEVQYESSHIYLDGLNRDDYIGRSGGLTKKADKGRIYVVRANGEVVIGERSAWFRKAQSRGIRPGDTIVVPLDTDRLQPLTAWSAVTQIIYQLAVAVAAVNSF